MEDAVYWLWYFGNGLQACRENNTQMAWEHLGAARDELTTIVIPVINRAQIIDDSFHLARYNEVNVLSIACHSENEECQTLATSLYSQWMSNSSLNPIHPNLRSTFYCTAIAAGGVREWDFTWKMFKETNLKAEADKLRYAMSCSKYVWILSRYLQYSLNRSMIQESDFVSTVAAIASNVVGQSLAWDFMQTHWAEISKKMPLLKMEEHRLASCLLHMVSKMAGVATRPGRPGGPEEGFRLPQTMWERPPWYLWGPWVQSFEAPPCRGLWSLPGGVSMPLEPWTSVWRKCWGEEEQGNPVCFQGCSWHFRHTEACRWKIARKHLEHIWVIIKGATSLHSRLESGEEWTRAGEERRRQSDARHWCCGQDFGDLWGLCGTW
ncbi:AMPN Aminopeptidase, partial [Polypterus senegalus]